MTTEKQEATATAIGGVVASSSFEGALLDSARVHEFAQEQHVDTFAKLCEAERTIVRLRAELEEWERLHPEPGTIDPKVMAIMARAALRVELGEIDTVLRAHGIDESYGPTLAERIHVALNIEALANIASARREDTDAARIASNVYEGAEGATS